MKCLVTGGAGFLGCHLVEMLLERGHDVRVLDNLISGSRKNVPDEADLIAAPADSGWNLFPETEVIWHLAAIPNVPVCKQMPGRSTNVNIGGTVSAVRAAILQDVGRVVFASSAAARHQQSIYGVQKRAAERMGWLMCKGEDTNFVSLRFENIYGPRANGGVVENFLRNARTGKTLEIHGGGKQKRDFLYVEDAAEAALRAGLTEKPPGREYYSVGTGKATSINELAGGVDGAMDSESRGHGGIETRHVEPREPQVELSCADPCAFYNWTYWEAQTMLQDGLRKTLRWMQDRGAA